MMDSALKVDGENNQEEIIPSYEIADWRHALSLPDELEPEKEKYKKLLMQKVEENGMLEYYTDLCESFGWKIDSELVERISKKNEEKLEKLNEKLEDAKTNFGDAEIRDAQLHIAAYYTKCANKEMSIKEYEYAYEKALGAGSKIDSLLVLTRIAFFYNDISLVKKYIHLTKAELEKGGDWERKNKQKVYEGIQLMACRKFKEAALLFLDCVSTFTAVEILSFEKFVFYAVVLSMLSLDRTTIKEVVMVSPEVMQIVTEDFNLHEFLFSFYYCKYKLFLQHLIKLAERVQKDRYLGKHYRYFIKNIRLRAYAQFLEPYRSVTLSSMAEAFGVSENFIENEISSFIGCGKLNCKIDKVNGVIESNAPDKRNAIYLQTIKNGDMLLNRVQKLSRVIDM